MADLTKTGAAGYGKLQSDQSNSWKEVTMCGCNQSGTSRQRLAAREYLPPREQIAPRTFRPPAIPTPMRTA